MISCFSPGVEKLETHYLRSANKKKAQGTIEIGVTCVNADVVPPPEPKSTWLEAPAAVASPEIRGISICFNISST